MFKAPGVTNAWVNIEPQGGANGNCSYGGQNSYGVNRLVFNANQANYNFSSIPEVANTLIITDTTYYDIMPKMTDRNANPAWPLGQFVGDPGQTQYWVTEAGNCGYANYWVQLGESACTNTTPSGNVAEETARMADVMKRNGGILNAAFLDGHAKGYQATRVVYDLVDNGNKLTSFWDPWKQGVK
jgi:prepilin-type processing-associated H-X9-DG protein